MTRQCGKRVWSDDHCDRQAGFPGIFETWFKMFGEKLDTDKAIEKIDGGDHFEYFMPNGYCAVFACDGNVICKTKDDSGSTESTYGHKKKED